MRRILRALSTAAILTCTCRPAAPDPSATDLVFHDPIVALGASPQLVAAYRADRRTDAQELARIEYERARAAQGPDSWDALRTRTTLALLTLDGQQQRITELIHSARMLYTEDDCRRFVVIAACSTTRAPQGHFEDILQDLASPTDACLASDPDIALLAAGVADTLAVHGDFDESEPLAARAVSALGAREERAARHLVAALYHQAKLYLHETQEFETALPITERAVRLAEQAYGARSMARASVLNQLGIAREGLGDFEEAGRALEEACAIRKELGGPLGRLYAQSLLNLGSLALARNEYAAAAKSYQEALGVFRSLNPNGDGVWRALSGLARAEVGLGRLKEALADVNDALRRGTREGTPAIAGSLNEERARVLLRSGAARDALAEVETALAKNVHFYGSDHPEVASALEARADVRLLLGGRNEDAWSDLVQAARIRRVWLARTMCGLPERQALLAEDRQWNTCDRLVGLATTNERKDWAHRAWDEVVRSRSRVLLEMLRRRRERRAGKRSEAEQEWIAASHRLGRLAVAASFSDLPEQLSARLHDAERTRDLAEAALARETAAPAPAWQAQEDAGVHEVLRDLPPGTALVGFYRRGGHAREELWDVGETIPTRYVAWVGLHDREPVLLDLGDGEALEQRVDAWIQEASTPPSFGSGEGGQGETRCREAGVRLREAIWDPLLPSLQGAERVLLVLDGALQRVSFGALPFQDGSFLVETGPRIELLESERDVIRVPRARAHGTGLIAIGAPDFDAPSGVGAAASERGGTGRFQPLPLAAREAEELARRWRRVRGAGPAIVLTGAAATERSFKTSAPGSRIIHLATHAFFRETSRSASSQTSVLRSSGLALAGANHEPLAADGPDTDDGILNAEEIATLDLRGVETVVLSACETARGQVVSGEGVLGLRRAFENAGVESLVMSLWPARDDATFEWMDALYAERLSGRSLGEASRAATLGLLARRRAQHQTTHPYTWGGFVAISAVP